ncbi:MAG: SurA N-terminal domain-containing protein [Oscillospiraceae bacterium]
MRKKILLSIVLIVIIVVIAVGAVDSGVMNKLEHLGRMVPEVLNSDDVLATYKERNVTAGMVTYWQEVEVMTYSADGTIHTEKPSKKEVVDRVLRSLILLDEAEQAGLTATDEQVNAAIAEQKSIAEEYPEIREQLEEYWEAAGMTEETYWTLLQQSFYEELTIANLQAILMTEYEEAGMTEEEAKAAYEAYKNGLIETHQDQITYYLDAS